MHLRIRGRVCGVPRSPHIGHCEQLGTYGIGELLKNDPLVAFDRLVLCGDSSRDYRWDQVRRKIKHDVVNDRGSRDIWPVLARVRRAGATGMRALTDSVRLGFTNALTTSATVVSSEKNSSGAIGSLGLTKADLCRRSGD